MARKNWFSLDVKAVAQELNSDLTQGISNEEAEHRLASYGPNTLQERPPRSLISMFIGQLKEVLVLILIVAAIVSGALGEWADTFVILVIVLLNAALGVFQENKAEQALKALKAMTKNMVKVLRSGKMSQVEADSIVPGDIVLLDAGDSIPADSRLIEAASLRVNESALTGESLPVEKDPITLEKEEVPIGDRKNMIFMGTTVTAGRAKALVAETGMNTELGKIAQMLQETPPDPTPLQRQLASLGKVLGIAAGIIVAVVFLTGLLRGENMIEMFMTAIALAVAAIPEGLPSVVTIVLALGVTRMSRRKAIIRKLPAVETLGVANYICSDKTGTLTKNEMTVTKLFVEEKFYQVTGTGYRPEGEFFTAEGSKISPLELKNLELILFGALLATDAQVEKAENSYRVIGDPTEGALVVAAAKAGLNKSDIEKKYPRIGELPFDSARKLMTTFHQMEGTVYSFTKGAPDVLLSRCQEMVTERGAIPLTDNLRSRILKGNSDMASEGLRILGLAFRQWQETLSDFSEDTAEKELTFVGFFGMQDPARPEAKDAVAVSRKAGIKTVMITGDHQDTAAAIAKELDIWRTGDGILTGSRLENMDEKTLKNHVEKTTVYARVSPEHKLRIIDALKSHGHVVAMTGDGVNDAPALKRADIGAAMGITGTEVSKEASDMVIMDDNFATIVNAVEEGRTIYLNIRKSIQYLLSCNTGEIVAIFSAILFGLGSPLTPIQILWLNLVTDGPPALALGLEPPEKGVMSHSPRSPKEGVFAGGVGSNIIIHGAVIGLLSLASFWVALRWGRTIEEAHTMAFLTMALSQLAHSFNVRSLNQSLFKVGLLTNPGLVGAFVLSVSLQLAVVLIPVLRGVFETAMLRFGDWLVVLGFSLFPLLFVEIHKVLQK
ncbi:MAG: calcium-translocating P-type ATPase, SERCA-type [Dehalobacterium sp.]